MGSNEDGIKKRIISYIADGVMSGVLLCIGCAVSMSVDSKPLGAFLFSLGLLAIIIFKFGLYTGKAGYMAVKPPKYILEVLLTILGNMIGTAIGGTLLNFTRFGNVFSERAAGIVDVKFSDEPLSMFVLAIFCGILMFTAVDGSARAQKNGNNIGASLFVIMPVMVFILCGFNHCVADMAYFFISRCHNIGGAFLYFAIVILGNAAGCMAIPIIKKLSMNK